MEISVTGFMCMAVRSPGWVLAKVRDVSNRDAVGVLRLFR
jgi:hypothetical protein